MCILNNQECSFAPQKNNAARYFSFLQVGYISQFTYNLVIFVWITEIEKIAASFMDIQ